ncbi:rhodanese-like domain-containing protein [Methylobacterium durans]|uniref:Rhodanese n=1 Tax=Methylobacterium durans TaxID=2202825 RepID=A0A2U8W2R7_9HYPH|nr:rhodanese-like domain-containing protein [Methylobacterium durans]AWN39642.1 rhodanese [Methylobacterium durans]
MARASLPARALRLGAALFSAVVLIAATPADSPVNVPEPAELWTGPPHGYTPTTLTGATVLDIGALDALMAEKPLLIDVGLMDRKPEGFPANRPWLPAHRSIPGAVWLPNAGAAPLRADDEALFFRRVEELTGGDRSKPVVTFCHPECWGSWNAGKRLVAKGFTRVYWFPEGVEGWQDRHETIVVRQDAAWAGRAPEPQR